MYLMCMQTNVELLASHSLGYKTMSGVLATWPTRKTLFVLLNPTPCSELFYPKLYRFTLPCRQQRQACMSQASPL